MVILAREVPFSVDTEAVIKLRTAPALETWHASASSLDDGWRYFDWFKGFKPEGENWIYLCRSD